MQTFYIDRTVTVVEHYVVTAETEDAALSAIYHGIYEPVDSDDVGDGEYRVTEAQRA